MSNVDNKQENQQKEQKVDKNNHNSGKKDKKKGDNSQKLQNKDLGFYSKKIDIIHFQVNKIDKYISELRDLDVFSEHSASIRLEELQKYATENYGLTMQHTVHRYNQVKELVNGLSVSELAKLFHGSRPVDIVDDGNSFYLLGYGAVSIKRLDLKETLNYLKELKRQYVKEFKQIKKQFKREMKRKLKSLRGWK